jgi:predicted enzyme related to lactoylglutathione lyase
MAGPAVAWLEVKGRDGPALQTFYGELFDWQVQDPGDGSGYGVVAAGPKGIGGGIGPAQDGGAGQVTFYVEVEDPAAYLAKAESLGAKAVVSVTEMPRFGLTFAFFADPEGHLAGLSKGAV